MKPTAISRKQKRSIETREKIFRTAVDLFRKNGFENTTVAEITAAADVGKGTFFVHFPTKEAVLGDIGRYVLQDVMKAHQKAVAKKENPARHLLDLFQAATRWHAKNKDLSELVSSLILLNPLSLESDKVYSSQFSEVLGAIIIGGIEQKIFSPKTNVDLAIQSLMGVYFFTLISWHRSGQKGNLVKQTAESLSFILRGISG